MSSGKTDTREDFQVIADFAKGRMGEEIVYQIFTKLGYEVIPLGFEHTNLIRLEESSNGSLLTRHAHVMPDFCLKIRASKNTYAKTYIEVKFRNFEHNSKIVTKHVIETIMKSYCEIDEYDDRKYSKFPKCFNSVLMLWLFRDKPCLCKIGNISNIFDIRWKDKIQKNIDNIKKIEWNADCLLSGNLPLNDSILEDDWAYFEKIYPQIIKHIFNNA